MTERARRFRTEEFLDYLAFERGLSSRTSEAYTGDLRKLFDYLEDRGVRHLEEITREDLRGGVASLSGGALSPSSVRRARSAMRTYFGFLVEEGHLGRDPSEHVASPRMERRLPDALTIEDTMRLLDAPDPNRPLYWRDRAILEVLYASGMRVSELTGLPLTAVDLDEGYALVFGKGSKERIVPLGDPALRALRRYLGEVRTRLDRAGRGQGRVFLTARGRPMRRESVWRVVRAAARRVGRGERVSPHTLRHTFATHLVEGGADLAAVQELLGHVDISTTEIYTHLDRGYLRDVHTRFHPRSGFPDTAGSDDDGGR